MIQKLFVYAPTVFLWGAVLLQVASHLRSRRPFSPAQRDLLLTLTLLAIGSVVVLPPVHLTIDATVGIPNLARLLANGLAVVACGTAQILLVRMTERQDRVDAVIRRYTALLVLALALLVGFFVAASPGEETVDFTTRFANQPFILEYKLVFLTCFGLSLANLSRLAHRYSGIAVDPSLRLGLLLITFGGLAGVLYALNDGCYVLGRRLGLPYPLADPLPVTQGLLFVSAGLVALGSTLPEWGPRAGVPAMQRWLSQHQSLRRLYPLWLALCRATPEIALVPPESQLRDALAVRDLGFRLYRRVVEIRDGCLALRPYRDPRVETLARELCEQLGLPTRDAEAAVEAVGLVAAIEMKRANRRVGVDSPIQPRSLQDGADLDGEVAALESVARYFGHSPIGRVVMARLGVTAGEGSHSPPPGSPQSVAGS